jgi:parallel beta-helix repeat protein
MGVKNAGQAAILPPMPGTGARQKQNNFLFVPEVKSFDNMMPHALQLKKTIAAIIICMPAIVFAAAFNKTPSLKQGRITELASLAKPIYPKAAKVRADAQPHTMSRPVNLTGVHNIIIHDKSIRGGAGPAITLTDCHDIRITRNKLYNSADVGIRLYNCRNITIDHNFFTNVSTGVYAERSHGGIVINYNQFLNMQGPFPRGQFVQFNNVSGAGNSISYNKGENIPGRSHPEDAISLFKSSGTAASPIVIDGNWIRGGGPSPTGGGIMLGDNGGSYLTASNNILVNPGQYGIAIAGGDHNAVINNIVYGRAQHFTNVGIYVWGQAGHSITNCTVSGNKIRYYNRKNNENSRWMAPGTNLPAGWDNNNSGAAIDASVLPPVIITYR